MNNVLEVKNLTVKYDKHTALRNVSFDVVPGQIISIIGPNGSGKSTLIKSILKLIPFEGEIVFEGKNTKTSTINIGYMPQSEEVDINFPITVYDVILQSQYRNKSDNSDELMDQAIKANELKTLEHRSLNQLSGGQLQRVFLARAMAQNSNLLLLDEPLSNMDISAQQRVVDVLFNLKNEGKSILITTHNLKLAHDISDKIILLNKKLICFGTKDSIFSQKNLIETFGEDVVFSNETEHVSVGDHHGHNHKH